MSKKYSLLTPEAELVINQSNKDHTTVSVTAKLISIDEEEGDVTVKITGLYALDFYGAEIVYHVGQSSITGNPEIKFTYHEIHRISKVGKNKVFINLR